MPESYRDAEKHLGYLIEIDLDRGEGIGGYWVWTADDCIAFSEHRAPGAF
jgi:hypothetical protein